MAVEIDAPPERRRHVARERLFQWTLVPAWVTIAGVVLLHLAGLSVSVPIRYGVLLVTLLLLGLPHGAADHYSVARVWGIDLTPRFLVGFCGAYLSLAAVYAVVWFVAPGIAFLGFLLLTWFHWGQGDVYTMARLLDGGHLADRAVRRLTMVVRGGLPMLVPLLAFPERYAAVAATVVGLFDPGAATSLSPLFTGPVRLGLGLAFAGLTILTLWLGHRRSVSQRAWLADAGETLGLWCFFALVPPVLAIGVYFAVWHSLRHISRLVELDQRALTALDRGEIDDALCRFARDTLPGTVGALVLFGGLALFAPQTPTGLADIGGVYLVLLAVLTLPHVVVVSWLDVRQGIWE